MYSLTGKTSIKQTLAQIMLNTVVTSAIKKYGILCKYIIDPK